MPAPPISFPLHLPQSQGPTSSSTTEPPPHIPSLGLGTFQPDPNLYPAGSVKASVLKALQVGYRHIDTALAYGFGQVEREVGEAIRESGIPREEVFVVTKLWVFDLFFNFSFLFLHCLHSFTRGGGGRAGEREEVTGLTDGRS